MKTKTQKLLVFKAFIILLILGTTMNSFSQNIPTGFNYQAVARDDNGQAYVNKNLIVEISIRKDISTGTIVWQEGHSVTTNEFGLFTLIIGKGVTTGFGTLNNFSDISWGNTSCFLQVRIDFGNGLVDMGTMEFLAVPYAAVANSVINYPDPKVLNPDTIFSSFLEVQNIKIPTGASNGYLMVSDSFGNATWKQVGGDVTGLITDLSVIKIQGNDVTSATPTISGQVLKWNNATSRWELGTDDVNPPYLPGTGISLNGQTINADSNNAIWNSNKLQGNNISTTAPSNGEVLKWNNTSLEWEAAIDSNTKYNAGTGIQFTGTTIAVKHSANGGLNFSAAGELQINSGIGLTLSGNLLNAMNTTAYWNANQLNGTSIDNTLAPANGDILKWNTANSQWEATTDDVNNYSGGNGIDISGTTISTDLSGNSGLQFNAGLLEINAGTGLGITGGILNADNTNALWNANKLQGSDVTTTNPNTTGQILKWNNTTSLWEIGTDNSSSYTEGTGITINGNIINADSNTAIWNANKLQGNDIPIGQPLSKQILKWNGTTKNWEFASDSGQVYSAGTGMTLNSNVFNADSNKAIWNADNLQGIKISTNSPNNGEVLTYNGTTWIPGAVTNTVISEGDGIDITAGSVISVELSANSGMFFNGTALEINDGTGLTLTAGVLNANNTTAMWNADQLQGNDISTTAPVNGEVLKWNNGTSEWEPGSAGSTYTGGDGIDITGTVIKIDPTANSGLTFSGGQLEINTGVGLTLSGGLLSAMNTTAYWNANQLQSRDIDNTAPSNGDVLKWNNTTSKWEPDTDNGQTYT
ncbi:MAG: hypothetical protein U9R42_11390, partial [Bacteroidota bacterium]|nr:hypothetical protein [Bacteroidota bacterium]